MTTQTLNTNQVAAAFGVSIVTIAQWRKGSAQRAVLKTCHDPAKSRFPQFRLVDVQRYAKKHNLEFAKDPVVVLETWSAKKPGPKPKNVETVTARMSSPAPQKPVGWRGDKNVGVSVGGKAIEWGAPAKKSSKSAKKKPKH